MQLRTQSRALGSGSSKGGPWTALPLRGLLLLLHPLTQHMWSFEPHRRRALHFTAKTVPCGVQGPDCGAGLAAAPPTAPSLPSAALTAEAGRAEDSGRRAGRPRSWSGQLPSLEQLG